MAGPARAPVPGVRLALELAALWLPTPADRRRYQAEFVAELYGLPPTAQLRHAIDVLSHAFALRAALGATSLLPEEAEMSSIGRRFCCHVLRRHDWQLHSTEDGGLYRSCSVCRRDHQGQLEIPNNFRMPWSS
jgi:hypothetical protein